MKSPKIAANSKIRLGVSNLLSLSNEKEILVDLDFLCDFNDVYFEEHFDWNQATDENVGLSWFITHHYCVQYHIKIKDLEQIEDELDNGSIGGTIVNPKLKNFWSKLKEEKIQRSLDKAKMFIKQYKKSLHKHNEHFTSSELLFLACFGEHKTSTLVAKLFQETNFPPPAGDFEFPFHKRTINLLDFISFC